MAKLNKKLIQGNVNRLVSLPGKDVLKYGDEDSMAQVVRDELGRAIERYARDDAHMDRIMEVLMATEFRPTPATVLRAAEQTLREISPAGCEICNGEPWVSMEVLHPGVDGTPVMMSGAKRCQCSKGQWLRAKDAENNAKRAAGLPV